MAIRWRKNGTLLCAAQSEFEHGDTYIGDRLHYQLAVISRAILPDTAHEVNHRYHWVHGTDFLRGVPEIEVLDKAPNDAPFKKGGIMILDELQKLLRETADYSSPQAADIKLRLTNIIREEEERQQQYEDELPFYKHPKKEG